MLTSGDIQFEPEQEKILPITTSIWCLIAGDVSMHMEIYQKIEKHEGATIASNPSEWINVHDIATLYSNYSKEMMFQKAEHAVLSPLGMNNEYFIKNQKFMDVSLIDKISTKLMAHYAPETDNNCWM